MYSAVSANEHTPILTQEAMPKIRVLMRQTVRQENHSSETNPHIPAQQTAQTMPPLTEAELRTVFRQPAKTGMQQRKSGRHILPCRRENKAASQRMSSSGKMFRAYLLQ